MIFTPLTAGGGRPWQMRDEASASADDLGPRRLRRQLSETGALLMMVPELPAIGVRPLGCRVRHASLLGAPTSIPSPLGHSRSPGAPPAGASSSMDDEKPESSQKRSPALHGRRASRTLEQRKMDQKLMAAFWDDD